MQLLNDVSDPIDSDQYTLYDDENFDLKYEDTEDIVFICLYKTLFDGPENEMLEIRHCASFNRFWFKFQKIIAYCMKLFPISVEWIIMIIMKIVDLWRRIFNANWYMTCDDYIDVKYEKWFESFSDEYSNQPENFEK